ncbi:hypothetical protein PBAC_22400 [Pedobacter glucosidilyticus]|nr:hypothetical protein [Pedobacter glucosidilyticus]KHJ37522.1 hypothetical protein PBAC_22400 [Pedobacter glucosidilyticus]
MEKKNYTLKVKTNRFIYHVSHTGFRKSILKNGLHCNADEMYGFRSAIFAHNSAIPDYSWFPFCFDVCWFWEDSVDFVGSKDNFESFAYLTEKYGYDFWRIDTWKIKNEWFLDDIGMNDFNEGSKYPFFVVTFEDIPPSALKRYEFHPEHKVIKLDGVAHIQGRFRAA